MDGAQIAVVLSALAAVGTVINGYLSSKATSSAQKEEGERNRLDLAWQMQEKQIERLTQQVDNQAKALQSEVDRGLQLNKELQECKAGRHQLEVQVEILRLQMGRREEP